MSSVRIFRKENRLAKKLRAPGGITVDEALKRADQRLETVREKSLVALDSKIDAIARVAANRNIDDAVDAAACAGEVFSLAGTFQLHELSQAAGSLHNLLLYGPQGEATPWDAILVHVNALRTLRRPELSGDLAARTAVVQGLRRVSERLKRTDDTGAS
jgi:hypothetical protein